MRMTFPGGLLSILTVLSVAVLGAVLYFHWWQLLPLVVPLAVCHVAMLYCVRLAAWMLVVAYVGGCAFFAYAIFAAGSFQPWPWRPLAKIALNLCVLHELRQWLRTYA